MLCVSVSPELREDLHNIAFSLQPEARSAIPCAELAEDEVLQTLVAAYSVIHIEKKLSREEAEQAVQNTALLGEVLNLFISGSGKISADTFTGPFSAGWGTVLNVLHEGCAGQGNMSSIVGSYEAFVDLIGVDTKQEGLDVYQYAHFLVKTLYPMIQDLTSALSLILSLALTLILASVLPLTRLI